MVISQSSFVLYIGQTNKRAKAVLANSSSRRGFGRLQARGLLVRGNGKGQGGGGSWPPACPNHLGSKYLGTEVSKPDVPAKIWPDPKASYVDTKDLIISTQKVPDS